MNWRTSDVRNIAKRRREAFFARDWLLAPGEEPPVGSHVVTPRGLYAHHGVYVGNGRVIHYAGLANGLRRGPVEDVSLEHFARGRDVRVRSASPRFDRSEVVARARSRLGERCYRVLTNNCEHFCEWALRGEMRSAQVDRLRCCPRAAWEALRRTLGGLAGLFGSSIQTESRPLPDDLAGLAP
jgi:hypothetical protein